MTPSFTLKLPMHRVDAPDEFLSAAAIGEMARAGEELGYGVVSVTDHPFPGVGWTAGGGHHTMDPFVALTVAAAATTRIGLQTSILVLPYRNPYIVAKAAASLDVVSGGRLALGVGVGYLPEEFAALDADFERRNETTDEAIEAIISAWQPEPIAISGGDPLGHVMRPLPLHRPALLVGGNSRRAIARAAKYGQGWLPMFNPSQLARRRRSGQIGDAVELGDKIAQFHATARELGRTERLTVHYSAPQMGLHGLSGDPAQLRAEVDSLAEAGVDAIAVDFPGETRAEWLRGAQRLIEAARA